VTYSKTRLARSPDSTRDGPGRDALNVQIVAVSLAMVPKQLHRGAA